MRTLSINLTNTASSDSRYFAGCDVGQKRDHSAVAVVEKQDPLLYLVHMRRFRLGTEFSFVIGYLKLLNERLRTVHRVLIDQTGVGGMFVEEARKLLKNADGVMLSLPKKQEIMVYLKKVMQEQRLRIPFDRELMNEMNSERYEMTKTGQLQFSHSAGTHDDRLWALALAVYASRPEVPKYEGVVLRGRSMRLMPRPPRPTGGGWPANWNLPPAQPAPRTNYPGKPATGVEETRHVSSMLETEKPGQGMPVQRLGSENQDLRFGGNDGAGPHQEQDRLSFHNCIECSSCGPNNWLLAVS